jgi:catechol 2,3-dioxygenase-like lactoylglutathione lyase family enzyme
VSRSAGLELVSLLVATHDPAIAFFVDVLGFELIEDSAAVSTRTGHAKRWVVVRPKHAQTGILLARADNATARAAIGNQHGGRVGFFLRVDDFAMQLARMRAAKVQFVGEPRQESYGQVVVFVDLLGNRWDLLG